MKNGNRFGQEILMTLRFPALMILLGVSVVAMAQTSAVPGQSAAPEQSPKVIVEQFWKMETSGGRLAADGWYKSSRFFVRMYPVMPAERVVHVIRDGTGDKVEVTARTENWAEVSVSTILLGSLDSALRFKPLPKSGAYGVLFLQSTQVDFHVVLTSKQWRVNHDGGRGTEIGGPPRWLIDCDESEVWIDREIVMQYVTTMRDKTNDPTIKKNAEETLAKLMKVH
jgi:hypothetical protein